MTLKLTVIGLLLMANFAKAQAPALPPNKSEPLPLRMFIDPSSTGVSLGKVHLTVNPLTRSGKFFFGDYRIKVVPYFFKNENGTFKLVAPGDAVDKLLEGIETRFIGKATTSTDGLIKVVIGKATPSANDRGSVTFSIVTENGLMVFNSFYHFGE